jgi:hypothetical protein
LQKPKLNYAGQKIDIYTNLFPIRFTRSVKIFQYPYTIEPTIAAENQEIRQRIFTRLKNKVRETYGDIIQSGDVMYALKKVEQVKSYEVKIGFRGDMIPYKIQIMSCTKEVAFSEGNSTISTELGKQIIEIMISSVLHNNANLDFFKNLFVDKTKKKELFNKNIKLNFFPGFTCSFVKTDKGNYVNVTLKNKIISDQSILEFMLENGYQRGQQSQKKIADLLTDRSFKTNYSKKNYVIEDVVFDRNPNNTTFNYQGNSLNLVNYYKQAHNIDIKDKTQPLLLVTRKGAQGEPVNLYFIPEICYLCGLDDAAVSNRDFMKELATYTKMDPVKRIRETNNFIELINSTTKKKILDKNNNPITILASPKEKMEEFGMQIDLPEGNFQGVYLKPSMANKDISKPFFPIESVVHLTNWAFAYQENNYDEAELLLQLLKEAAPSLKIKINDPKWIEIPNSRAQAKDYINAINKENPGRFQFILVLMGHESVYHEIKKDSQCRNGYITQMVKSFWLKKAKGRGPERKKGRSVATKLLFQINSKLGGFSYTLRLPQEITSQNLMLIGIESSHISGKRTGVAMNATINKTFTQFFSSEEVIPEEKKETLVFNVSSFIKKAIVEYRKLNRENPEGIVIYRQGVSLQQKNYLEEEVKEIDSFLAGNDETHTLAKNPIKYYYVLVNTKTNYKFFERSRWGNKIEYQNPKEGLLIYEGVSNPDFFEFFIQPQKVTGGSATPTCYHVAYGNLNIPHIIPQLTLDLCFLYSNWQGPVRIPNVSKNAEKLSKLTAKSVKGPLHPNLVIGQSYL